MVVVPSSQTWITTGIVTTVSLLATWILHVRKKHRPQKGAISNSSYRLFSLGKRMVLSKLLDMGGFFSVDIGGSLTKLVFFLPDRELIPRVLRKASPSDAHLWNTTLNSIDKIAAFIMSRTTYGRTGVRDDRLSFHMNELGGTFHFIRFETRRMGGALALARSHGLNANMHTLCATGGGAHKFRDEARAMLGIHLDARDEIDCLVKGMIFLLAHVPLESYTFEGSMIKDKPKDQGVQYPYLLVNVGSGVGFILVLGEGQWQRVSGTSLGGGTYYGLCHMLTGLTEFDEMLDAAELGDNSNVDLTVGDIYGGDYNKFGLKASTIAASFGKAVSVPLNRIPVITETRSGRSFSSSAAALIPEDNDTLADGSFSTIGGPALRRSDANQLLIPISSSSSSSSIPLSPDRVPKLPLNSSLSSPSSNKNNPSTTYPSHSSDSTPSSPLSTSRSYPAELTLPPDSTAPKSPRINGLSSAIPTVDDRSFPKFSPSTRSVSPTTEQQKYPSFSSPSSSSSSSNSAPNTNRYSAKDISRALLIMVSNNIGQLAYLNASKHKCKDIYFAGNFLRHENTIAMRTLAYAITFWSKGTMAGLFLRHEGYCGALGAFLSTLEMDEENDDFTAPLPPLQESSVSSSGRFHQVNHDYLSLYATIQETIKEGLLSVDGKSNMMASLFSAFAPQNPNHNN